MIFDKNNESLNEIQKALERHPDVFADLVKQLQAEAGDLADQLGSEVEEAVEEEIKPQVFLISSLNQQKMITVD